MTIIFPMRPFWRMKQEALILGGVFISCSGRAASYVMLDYTETQCKTHGGVKLISGPTVGDICGIPACFSYDLTSYNSFLGFDALLQHF